MKISKGRLGGRHASAAVIGVLTVLLGFAIAVQVHANSSSDTLAGLREDDLIGILDNQNARADRLRQQLAELQENLRQLQDSGDRSAAARKQAAEQAQTLGVLLGTLPAAGPGRERHRHRPQGASSAARTCSTSSRSCAAPAPRRSSSAACGSAPRPRSAARPAR